VFIQRVSLKWQTRWRRFATRGGMYCQGLWQR
jgi:hypothetical protein